MTYQELKNNIKKIINREEPPMSIWYYLQGNYRYWLYYSKFKSILIRKHILEQIDFRIKIMNKQCYQNGSCIKCGCMTLQLQMCNKPCKGLEYPPIVDRITWDSFMKDHTIIKWKEYIWLLNNDNKLVILIQTYRSYERI